jgi:hypothetical protein
VSDSRLLVNWAIVGVAAWLVLRWTHSWVFALIAAALGAVLTGAVRAPAPKLPPPFVDPGNALNDATGVD